MTWRFEISPSGWDDVRKLDSSIQKRILERLTWFTEHFDQIVPLVLTGDYGDSFKLRVGDWRVIYEVKTQKETVYVLRVEHRSKVYKKRR